MSPYLLPRGQCRGRLGLRILLEGSAPEAHAPVLETDAGKRESGIKDTLVLNRDSPGHRQEAASRCGSCLVHNFASVPKVLLRSTSLESPHIAPPFWQRKTDGW